MTPLETSSPLETSRIRRCRASSGGRERLPLGIADHHRGDEGAGGAGSARSRSRPKWCEHYAEQWRCWLAVRATLSDFTGYEDAGKSGAPGTGIGPCSASNARPLVARLRGLPHRTPCHPGKPSRQGRLTAAARCVFRATPTELGVCRQCAAGEASVPS